jgi:hypothetical protein
VVSVMDLLLSSLVEVEERLRVKNRSDRRKLFVSPMLKSNVCI